MPLLSRSDFIYQVRIYDNSSNLIGLYDDFVAVYYKKSINQPGLCVFTVPDGHPLMALLVDDLLMEVFFICRPLVGGEITDFRDFIGLYRDRQIATDGDGKIYHLLYFPGVIEIISRNIVNYRAGINGKTSWVGVQAGIIAEDIVRSNCAAPATVANGRLRNANVIRNLGTVSLGTTPVIDYSASYRNVLEVVQELAKGGGFDFDVIRINAITTDLRWYAQAGQLGTDRHTTIVFDLNLDNIAGANLNGERLSEKTVAIVGGQDVGAARTITIRTGLNQSASNDYETFIDARSNEAAELPAIGDAKLSELEARRNLDIDIAPSAGYVYRRDYGLGDLVSASFAGTIVTKKITTVEVKFDQTQESTVRIELTNP